MKSKRSDLDQLRTDIETLESCSNLIATSSPNKARTAIIILDHFAEILLFRETQNILERDHSFRWVMRPKFSLSDHARVSKSFHAKVQLVADQTTILKTIDEAVLFIAHSYRNAIYHRDTHNDRTTVLLAKITLRTILRLFMLFGSQMSTGGTFDSKLLWFSPYDSKALKSCWLDFVQVRRGVVRALAPGAHISFRASRCILIEDIQIRAEALRKGLGNIFGDELPWVDDLFKHVQFEYEKKEKLNELSLKFRETTYKIHTDSPPTKEEYFKAESDYQALRKKEFDFFRPTYTIDAILALSKLSNPLFQASDLRELLIAYKDADDAILKVEHYFDMAHEEFDKAVEMEIDAGR